jgi:hypothetical protein
MFDWGGLMGKERKKATTVDSVCADSSKTDRPAPAASRARLPFFVIREDNSTTR